MTPAPQIAWRPSADGAGLIVRVRLTPRAARDAIAGLEVCRDGPAVKAHVRAVPEDGKANAALAGLVAEWLGIPKRSATVTAGHKSRVKSVTVAGEPAELAARLERLLAAA